MTTGKAPGRDRQQQTEPVPVQSWRKTISDLLTAYRIPISVLLLAASWWLATGGDPQAVISDTIPPELLLLARYTAVGGVPGLILGYVTYKVVGGPKGTRVMEIEPETGRYRDMRIATETWLNSSVVTPDGNPASHDEIQMVEINGEIGYEVRNWNEEQQVITATWMGGATSSEIRGWRNKVWEVATTLSRQADRALGLEASIGEVARDAARDVIRWMVQTEQEDTVPNGEAIADAIEGALDRHVETDPTDVGQDDDRPDRADGDQGGTSADREPVSSDVGQRQAATNGHGGRSR